MNRSATPLGAALDRLPRPEHLTIALFAYISWVPFYYLRPLELGASLPSFYLPKYLPLLLCLAISLLWVLRLWQGERPLPLTPALWGVPYLAFGLLSLVGADYPLIGTGKWAYYHLTGILFGYIVAQHLRDWLAIERLASGIALVAGITAVYSLFGHLLGRDVLWGAVHQLNNPFHGGTWRLTAPFGNSVSTASYLALCLPFLVWKSAFASHRPWSRWLFAALSLVTAIDILFTQSRGGWLALGVGLLVAFLLLGAWAWRREHPARRWVALLILLLSLSVGGSLAYRADLHRLFAAQLEYMDHRASLLLGPRLEETEHYRLDQYRNVLELLRQHPFLGVGFGNFTRLYEQQKTLRPEPERNSPVHTTDNMYLMFAAETGSLGLAAALALVGAVFWNVARAGAGPSGPSSGLALAFLAGGLGFLVNMATWDPLNDPTLRITFWIMASTAVAAARSVARGA